MTHPRFSYASFANLSFIENLYEDYKKDPHSVDPSWRSFFEGVEFAVSLSGKGSDKEREASFLLSAYRRFGHKYALCNPLAFIQKENPPIPKELDLALFGLDGKLSEHVLTYGILPEERAPLSMFVQALQKIYCGTLGVEYSQIREEVDRFIQEKLERFSSRELGDPQEQVGIWESLLQAEYFENFLHTKYVGQKRFSLEGAETLLPLLKALLENGAVAECVLGMAHRGRLNVLAHLLGKPYQELFKEFEGEEAVGEGGDVKYHKGFTGYFLSPSGQRKKVTLVANPSHLESVNPVVAGFTRAKQEQADNPQGILPILIHGDAALSGQGVVYESIQLEGLKGYSVGGVIHIVINNQVGFTATCAETRTTRYCTAIARAFGFPVFHVNAECPEECVFVAKLAVEIRQRFSCDVFIDLNCYRKYGHNEGDEPTFTQPLEYRWIKERLSLAKLYQQELLQKGVLNTASCQQKSEALKEHLSQEWKALHLEKTVSLQERAPKEPSSFIPPVSQAELLFLTEQFTTIPPSFHIHPKLQRIVEERRALIHSDPKEKKIDWGVAEHLAYATLLKEGIPVRLSGQDSARGTFSHRHALWKDYETGGEYVPLAHLESSQSPFTILNSPLSEFAVLGFEFGYSVAREKGLVIWEAQFGDFANGAQIIIDQYLAASSQKWKEDASLVLFLPHGYEGQGPEHSSARIERFLQLCAQDNLLVANCTTPVQLFYLLRRQAYREERRPLILFTPKALLRHPECLSSLEEFCVGGFEEVLETPAEEDCRHLLLCSGKVFYDLLLEREKKKRKDTALIRIEQLYPFPEKKLSSLISQYPQLESVCFVQEEPMNMGSWAYISPYLEKLLPCPLRYVGRSASASVAVGSYALHKQQLEELLQASFNP